MEKDIKILKPLAKTAEISWEAIEFNHKPSSADWYWTIAFASAVIAVIAWYVNNILFAIFAILSGLTIILFKFKEPQTLTIRLTPHGIVVKNVLYPYGRIESFWIYGKKKGLQHINELSIKSDRAVLPQIIIPLGDMDAEMIRDYLSVHLCEEYHEKTLADIFTDYLGF